MERFQRLVDRINDLGESLASDALEPKPGAPALTAEGQALTSLVRTLETDVVAELTPALTELEGATQQEAVRQVVAELALKAAGALMAAGRADEATRVLRLVKTLTDDKQLREIARQAELCPAGYVHLAHGRWFAGRAKYGPAQRAFRRALALARSQGTGLVPFIEAAIEGGVPVASAPSLATMNGIGTMLLGRRDEQPDGSYIATQVFSFLFLPLVPLAAFRVTRHVGDSYTVHSRHPLSAFASWARLVVPVAFLVGVAALGAASYTTTSRYRSRQALAEAEALAEAGDAEGARRAYDELLITFADDGDVVALRTAADVVIARLVERVPTGGDGADVAPVKRALERFGKIPQHLRARQQAALAERALAFLDAAGKAGIAPADLEAVAAAGAAAFVAPERDRFKKVKRALLLARAEATYENEPLRALVLFVEAKQPPARLRELVKPAPEGDPALWRKIASILAPAIAKREPDEVPAKEWPVPVLELHELFEAAEKLAMAPGRVAALTAGDAKVLKAHLKKAPRDQEVALGLARLLRAEGDSQNALALLDKASAPGWRTFDTEHERALLLADLGRLPEAEALAGNLLADRLPKFRAARQAYESAYAKLEKDWIERAQRGLLPKDIQKKIQFVSDEDANRIFFEWLSTKLAEDEGLEERRVAYEAEAGVVELALTLGMLKLQHSQEVTGDERAALLKGAEEAFRAIQVEAGGGVAYQLSLGEVLHRLGKVEEAEKELSVVEQRGEPPLFLQLAYVYRNIGEPARARALAEKAYATDDERLRYDAAMLVSLLARDLDEEALWLGRADPRSDTVRLMKAGNQASRSQEAGRWAEADRALVDVVKGYLKTAADDHGALNNAANALLSRYLVTGRSAHLDESLALLRRSLRLSQHHTVPLWNTINVLQHQRGVRVLRPLVDIEAVKPTPWVAAVLETSLTGAARAALTERRARDPATLEIKKLAEQYVVLAPGAQSAYSQLAAIYAVAEDEEALRRLLGKAKERGAFDDEEALEAAESEPADAERARELAAQEAQIARLDEVGGIL